MEKQEPPRTGTMKMLVGVLFAVAIGSFIGFNLTPMEAFSDKLGYLAVCGVATVILFVYVIWMFRKLKGYQIQSAESNKPLSETLSE